MKTPQTDPDPIDTVVLNGLVATVVDDSSFLADAATRTILDEVLRSVTDPAQRATFHRAVTTVPSNEDPTDTELTNCLREVTRAVRSELDARNRTAVVTHRVPLDVHPREAHLYSYGTTGDATVLDRLELPPDVTSLVERGGHHIEHDDPDRAVDAFERAVTESTGGRGSIATRVLAGLANHWHGDDDRALDFVEEALHLDTGTWTARLVGLAADHEYSDRFRERELGARVFLRYRIDVPPGSDVLAQVGFSKSPADTWRDLEGGNQCCPLDVLSPRTWIQFRLSGSLPSFPAVQGYYVALGVVDLDAATPLDVERILLSGPQTADSTDVLRVE